VDYRIYRTYLELCGYRWTLEILTALRERPHRFTDLIQAISPTPSPKSLNEALKRLQDHNLVDHPVGSDGALYGLTDAGTTLVPLLLRFLDDLRRWHEQDGAAGHRPSGRR
jgi:DNA-binding HxlR family transcriptional regulator